MKKFTLLLFVFGLISFATPNAEAVIPVQPTKSSIEKSSNASTAAVTKTLTKREARKMKRQERRMKRKAKFLAWMGGERNGIIAAVICFLIGGLGIHRVYMGSKPIIILWYFLTIGGIFGLLPLIDFFRLLLGGADHYDDNDKLFAAFGAS